MAARFSKEHDERTRLKIKTSQIINRLNDHVLSDGDVMTVSQVNAARILLNKTLPDMANVTIQGPGENGEHKLNFTLEFVNADKDS